MTLSDIQGHSFIARLFKCDFSYSYAATDKISTETARRTVPVRLLSFLLFFATALKTDTNSAQFLLVCNVEYLTL